MRPLYKHVTLLLLIGIIAFLLRTINITHNPPSLSWDEVSIGYNAYSILITGYDEHYRFLPLDTFVAYGDYKPPLSIYLTVPFVAIFGLNELAVRLPSALFGTFTVLIIYFLVKELIRIGQMTMSKGEKIFFSLLCSFLLAISPWHINLSRAGFEANIALFFVVLGMIFLLKALRCNFFRFFAWIPFVLAMFTFNSSRYFVLLAGVWYLLMFNKDIKKNLLSYGLGLIIACILVLPLLPHLLSKEARLRFTEVNIFTDISVVETANKRIEAENNSIIARIVFNRRIGYAIRYIQHFFDHFDPKFLFIRGDGNPKLSTQDVGQLYLIEAPLLVIGIISLYLSYPIVATFLLFWLLTAIVPAAMARETPHALRTLNSLPTWQIFIGYGIVTVLLKVNNRVSKYCIVGCLCLIYFGSACYYVYNYHVHYPREFSNEWQYGYKQAIQFIAPIMKNYDTIYISDKIGRPYMYTLFYSQFDPRDFWKTKQSYFDTAGFYHVDGFSKYKFIQKMPGTVSGRVLIVGEPHWPLENQTILSTIRLLNGDPILKIFEL